MSLTNQTETPTILHRFRRGIGWNLRNSGNVLYWTGVVIAAVLLAAILTLYFLDWNTMRGPIGRYASARTGHEVRIDGDLKVQLFRLQPHVDVGGLYIGNPAWLSQDKTPRPHAALIKQASFEFRLLPAIFGNIILPLVQIDDADLLLVRAADNRTNWDSDASGPSAAWKIPPIQNFLIKNGHVEIEDAIRKLKFVGTISSREQGGDAKVRDSAFQLTGDGTLNGQKFLAEIHGGPLINVDASRPYAFTADVKNGDTHAVLNGNIVHPFALDEFNANIIFKGKNLSDLYFLTGLALPRTPPYTLATHTDRKGAIYRLTSLTGTVGASDLKGDLTVNAGGKKPLLTGTLSSQVVDFSDLGSVFGGGKTVPASEAQYLLPDTALHTERLRDMDADIAYTAASIRSRDFPLRGLATHIHLENAILDFKPIAFDFAQGRLSGSFRIDARKDVPVTSLDARLSDIKMENFIKGAEKPISGTAMARAVLTGSGNSAHKVAATASGTATAVIPSGQIRQSLAEWLGINVLSALSLTLTNDESNTGIRCAVAHVAVNNGVMFSQQFVIDTDPVLVKGSGTIDLGRESMDLKLQGAPKSFQLFRLRSPITVSGPLQNPSLGVEAGPAVAQGAVGLGLAALNPFAAILAFLDPGLADNANCAALLSTAKAQGAPVQKTSVKATAKKAP